MSVLLVDNLASIRSRIADAALRCRRSPEEIALLAVSKQQSAVAIRSLFAHGQHAFGESYLQEALPKIEALCDLTIDWHYVGQIQSNKTRPIAEHFRWVHTVDRSKIAERLSEQRPVDSPPLNVCIQVKLEEEPGKGGVRPEEVAALAQSIAQLPRLRLRGVMCIPPPRDTFAEQRALFDRCAALLRSLNDRGFRLDTLSMGMSDDLEAAIAAGSTMVRIGTALFGQRPK